MNGRKFEVGDPVTFELARDDQVPRWSRLFDFGGSGKWGVGCVGRISGHGVEVFWISHGGRAVSWLWPQRGASDIPDNIWERPGYLRKLSEGTQATETKESTLNGKCTCTHSFLVCGCTCGGK